MSWSIEIIKIILSLRTTNSCFPPTSIHLSQNHRMIVGNISEKSKKINRRKEMYQYNPVGEKHNELHHASGSLDSDRLRCFVPYRLVL